jgi:DNA polymerase alpha subunit B
MGVVIAAGPYTHSDGLTYEPLQSLVRYVKEHKPHLLIICGPFIDSAQQNVQDSMMEDSYEQFFLLLCQSIFSSNFFYRNISFYFH